MIPRKKRLELSASHDPGALLVVISQESCVCRRSQRGSGDAAGGRCVLRQSVQFGDRRTRFHTSAARYRRCLRSPKNGRHAIHSRVRPPDDGKGKYRVGWPLSFRSLWSLNLYTFGLVYDLLCTCVHVPKYRLDRSGRFLKAKCTAEDLSTPRVTTVVLTTACPWATVKLSPISKQFTVLLGLMFILNPSC